MKIDISGKEYNVEYDNLTLFKIEKELDMGLSELLSDPKKLERLHVAATIVWCGIKDNISFEDFAKDIKLSDLTQTLGIVGELINNAYDTGEKVKKK